MKTITTFSTLQKSISNRSLIAKQDGETQKARYELTSGLSADVYKDSGFRSTQTLDLRNRMARVETFATSNKLLDGKLEVMSSRLSEMRSDGQAFLASALAVSAGEQDMSILAAEARSTLTKITEALNSTYAGQYLFSGDGLAERSINFGGQFAVPGTLTADTDLAGVNAQIAEMNAYFGVDGVTASAQGYSATVYAGNDGKQQALIAQDSEITFEVSADAEGFREIFKGLAMLSQYDLNVLAPESRKAWMEEATRSVANGLAKLQSEEAFMGNQRQLVSNMLDDQNKLITVYNARIVDIEGVDSYEAATRLEALTAQLEASYAVTARLKSLSLLNYM